MRRRAPLLALGALSMLVLLPATARAGHETLSALLPGDPLEGSRLFAAKGCVGCHGVYGVGATAGPDLGRGILNRPLLEIAAVMWNHAPGMERLFAERGLRRPTFEPAEMASLLTFLYYLGSLDPPGDAERGRVLFKQKECESCHAVGGRGGRVGPGLDRYSRYASPLFLTAALWNRGPAMAKVMAGMRVARPAFQGSDISDLLAFIRSTGGDAARVYAPPGSPKRGEALFAQKRCAECHAVRGHGGRVGPDLALQLRGSLLQIAGAMWNHGPRMWTTMAERGVQVPPLSTEEMSDLVGYLYFFQFIDPPGDPRRGQAVYRDKRCGSCHGAQGSKLVAPALAEVAEKLKTPLAMMTAMWNHAGQMTQMMMEENVAWPVLKGGEMADLIAYLLGAQPAPARPPAPKGAGAPTGKGPSSPAR